MTAVMGNHVVIATGGYGPAKPQADAGKIRFLFSFTPPGVGPMPNGPNIRSVFGKDVPDFEPHGHCFVAPGKTPENIIKLLDQTLEKITKDPEFVGIVENFGLTLYHTDINTAPKELERRASQVRPILQAEGLLKK